MKKKEPQPCAHLSPDGDVCRLVTAHLRPGETAPCVYPEFKIRGGRPNSRSSSTGGSSCPIILLDKSLDEHYPKGLTGVSHLHRCAVIKDLYWDYGITSSGVRRKLDTR